MPRNGSGTMTVVNTFTPSTIISSSQVNANFADIVAQLTNSLAADGQTTMLAAIKGADGVAATPSYSFASDSNTGIYRKAADSIGMATAGVERAYIDSAGKLFALGAADVAGALAVAGATSVAALSASGTISAAGTIEVGHASDTTLARASAGDLTVEGNALYRAGGTDVAVADGGTGASTAAAARTNLGAVGSVGVQRFTSGSGTYTPTAGTLFARVRMVGGGGGGGAVSANNGAVGTDTSFGSWTAIHGNGGTASGGAGGNGGTGGANGTGTLIERVDGANGGAGSSTVAIGGKGGSSVFGGAGNSSVTSSAGVAAKANSGSGGGGGTPAASNGGGGGGAGEYVEFFMTIAQIGASQAYTVGGGGNGGAAGTQAGGNGAAGVIIVEEFA